MKPKIRDVYLDFYRGIAAISVVLIHTVYWSGEGYLSESILRTLVLLVDVPLFVFLSGWSAYYTADIKKTFDNLLKIWLQYIIFMVIINIVCHIILYPGTFSVQRLLYQIAFIGETPYLPVIAGSLWFMPMWIPVSLVGSILGVFLLKKLQYVYIIRIVTFLLIGIVWFSITNQSSYFLFSRDFCFYLVFFLLGHLLANRHFKGTIWQYFSACTAIILLWYLVSRMFQIPATDLQGAKFPPHLMYFVASFHCNSRLFSRENRLYCKTLLRHQIYWKKCPVILLFARNWFFDNLLCLPTLSAVWILFYFSYMFNN